MASSIASTSAVPIERLSPSSRPLELYRDYSIEVHSQLRRGTILSTRLKEVQTGDRATKAPSTAPPLLEIYVHWAGSDPRLDCWIDERCVRGLWPAEDVKPSTPTHTVSNEDEGVQTRHKRRAREDSSPAVKLSATGVGAPNLSHQPRNITSVIFGWHDIKTWYDSPYQLEEVHTNTASTSLLPSAAATSSLRTSQPPRPVKKARLTGTETPPLSRAASTQPTQVDPLMVNIEPEKPSRRAAKQTIEVAVIPPQSSRRRANSFDESSLLPQPPPLDGRSDDTSLAPSQLSLNGNAQTPPTSPDLDPPAPNRQSDVGPLPITVHDVHSFPVDPSKPPTPVRGTSGRFVSTGQPTKRQLKRAGTATNPPPRPSREQSPAIPPSSTTTGARTTAQPVREDLQLVPPTGMSNLKDGRIFVCDGCFKYMAFPSSYEAHRKQCKVKYPPGRKVWQRGMQTIWEVDGAQAKLWCQNLCLFGKLFIDHKYVFFDVEGFLFYVLCEGDGARDYMLGFFSKEKVSYDDFNLACIVILPPYQKRSYGVLLIELSYVLHSRSPRATRLGIAGTPERPLSDLGLRGYLAFWTGVVVRYLRRLVALGSVGAVERAERDEREAAEAVAREVALKRAKKNKGWVEGVTATPTSAVSVSMPLPTPSPKRMKGEAVEVSVATLARATMLRVEDVVLALSSSGLLATDEEGGRLVVTAEAIERVGEERKVRPPLLELSCMLPLDEV